jgi:lipopolysaccharide export system protein LptA
MLGKRKNTYSSGRHRILVVSVLCLFGFCLLAQVRPAKKGEQKPAKSKVYLLHSDVLKKSPLNPDPDAQILIGNVAFRHDSVYMYCDSACFYEKTNSLEAFDNVKMVQGDTLFLYGDYLFYDGNTQIAQVRYNVRMENKNTTLLTDSLNYDRIYNLGYYFDGGTLMDEENVLTSEWGEYSPATKISVFNYDVKLVNPKFTLTSDTLRYSTATKIANILGPSDIVSDANHIYSELGFYNTQIGQAELLDRSVLTNEGKRLIGDSLFYDRVKGYGEAFDNVIMTDTVNKNMLTGDYCYYNELTKYAFATKKAVVVDYSQGDSLFMHADTLQMYTYYLNTDSMFRETRAYHKVRMYRADVQGVCDSLVFSSKDSCLTMYYDPILWNNNQQLLGEKIMIYMNDSTIDWAHIQNQALSVEQLDSTSYNQVTGKEMKAWFQGGEMRKVDVIGSVRLVYYPMESDSTLIGMNVSETSLLNMFLENRKMKKMIMSPKSNGTLYPMLQRPPEKMKLDNFVWFDYIRPLDKEDIFEWRGKKAGQELKKSNRSAVPLPNHNLFKEIAMGMFKMEKPRRFNHQYIYVDERKEKLQKLEEKAKRDLGMLPPKEFSPEDIRGKFVEGTKHLKRRKESGRKPMTYGALFVAILVLLYILHYLVTGEFTF